MEVYFWAFLGGIVGAVLLDITEAPQGVNALLASTLSHIPYGFGVGAVVALGLQ